MKGKNEMMKKVCAALLALTMMPTFSVSAVGIQGIEERLSENQERLEAMKEEKEAVEGSIQSLSEEMRGIVLELAALSNEIHGVQREVRLLSEGIREKELEIESANVQIQRTESSIELQIRAIAEREEDLSTQEGLLEERVRAAYKQNATQSIILLLVESRGFLDFLERLVFVERMTKQDNLIMNEIQEIIEDLREKRAQLEEARRKFVREKDDLESRQMMLMESRLQLQEQEHSLQLKQEGTRRLEREKEAAIQRMNADERRIAQTIGDIMMENEELEQELQEMIREAQRRAEEERKRKEEEERKRLEALGREPSVQAPSAQGYLRPVPGRLTSGFGFRIHPIFGDRRFHTGVDFAGATGTSIRATRSGTVIMSQYYGGYGNTVIIDHGGGVSSLYAHMHTINVRIGGEVGQGSIIGTVGNTGNSTGPHLHFEIRMQGNPVNPLNYLP